MKTIQIKDLDLYNLNAHKRYCLYVIRDMESIFYVGQSCNVVRRLREHRGNFTTPQTPINEFIRANWPRAREWSIDVYTLNDLPLCENVDEGELVLISRLRPCFNTKNNLFPLPVPGKYNRTVTHKVTTEQHLLDAIDKLSYD